MLDARIHKYFPGVKGSAAYELNVHLRSASGVTVLFGPSGAGKSLTLDAIAGFVRPDEGRILVDDRLLFDAGSGVNLPPRERACGCVFQGDSLFPHMSLFENLWFATARFPLAERRRRTREMLERFHLEEFRARRPGELSGGQRQRGAIARALLSQPSMLLLDEPARGLDAGLRDEFYSLLREVRAGFGVPVVLVTHDLDEALECGESMHVLIAGRLVQSGAPAEILDAPASAQVAALLGCYNVLRVTIVAMDPAANRSRLSVAAPDGHSFEIAGPYFPGLFLGASVTLAVREDELEFGPNLEGGVKLEVERHVRLVRGVRVELRGGLRAIAPDATTEQNWSACSLRVNPGTLRLLKA